MDQSTSQKLIELARNAAENAYCPYSQFPVGAAVVSDGKMYFGCNVENASYGLAICAERAAIFSAISSGCTMIDAVAIVCPAVDANAPIEERMPCGACRQVIAEFGDAKTRIFVDGVGEFSLEELLGHPFKIKK